MPHHRLLVRHLLALLVLSLLLAACGSAADAGDEDGGDEAAQGQDADQLAVAVASFDLAVGDDRRLLAGVYTPERQLLAFGEVTYELGYLGENSDGQVPIEQTSTASYLPVPGWEPDGESSQPELLEDVDGNGVYAGEVDLDRAGIWGLRVTAQLDDGRTLQGVARFQVAEEPLSPAVGDEAPRTDNLTMADLEAGDADPAAVDSQARDGGEVPDPALHERTVAEAIEDGRPAVVTIATPVYCQSRFCGPLVDTLADLAPEYEHADFIHIEVWEDFDEGVLNDAATDWIDPEVGNEPWVFLVDGDGTVVDRWANVLDVAELEEALAGLDTGA